MTLAQLTPHSAFGLGESSVHQPGAVDRALKAVREHLGMEVAFLSRVADGKVVIRNADTNGCSLLDVGDVFAAEDSYCQRVIDGRLPFVIADASKNPEAARLACTRELPIGAHISVPLRLSDGSIYGTFCCFSRHPDPSLTERDLRTLQAFAELAAEQIEAELTLSALHDSKLARIGEIIDRGSVTMEFQPIFRLEDRAVVGFEALACFPGNNDRPANEWFEEARQVGLGSSLELVAVRSALRAVPYLPSEVYLAINVSPDTLFDPGLEQELAAVAEGRVVLEVMENAIVSDYEKLTSAFDGFRPKVRFAVDNTGAGYSTLRRIFDLQPDLIKLGISLTRDIDTDSARRALAMALVTFGLEIGSQIIAEGVETAQEYQSLCRLGLQFAQGPFLQRPMPVTAAAQLAHAR